MANEKRVVNLTKIEDFRDSFAETVARFDLDKGQYSLGIHPADNNRAACLVICQSCMLRRDGYPLYCSGLGQATDIKAYIDVSSLRGMQLEQMREFVDSLQELSNCGLPGISKVPFLLNR